MEAGSPRGSYTDGAGLLGLEAFSSTKARAASRSNMVILVRALVMVKVRTPFRSSLLRYSMASAVVAVSGVAAIRLRFCKSEPGMVRLRQSAAGSTWY